ncbi:Glycosyltransferase involved in cell wall bisynthesis [Clostridium cavendishii DSM 21758]|uniref:Glycosyltransferase involved in cell wall bisynthesis n=1 Tax=Clostridium cavendishii DSM 21758 TaxID=1121302 RepID=A0A1M6Q755_9CLOT|nr:glycosyltransferase family 4 protein [Clostridium cavendishii]SHK15947.1 Glycosyltransferase involved in cell wall bisynthesis [Clostridium cavendishii DSM 21758]
MKICQITPYWDVTGGITTVVTNLVNELIKRENEVYVLSSDLKKTDDNLFKLSNSFITKNKEILAILRRIKPDVVHVHAHGTLLPATLIYKYFFNNKVKLLCTFHTKPSSGSELTKTQNNRSKLRDAFVNLMMHLLDYNVFVSEDLVDSYKKYMGVTTTKNNYVIYNGISKPNVDEQRALRFKEKIEIEDKTTVFSMISNLQWDLKVIGVGKLIQAFDKFNKQVDSNTKLFIAGDGEFRAYLEKILKEVNNENIILLGQISNVEELLFLTDIYCHISPQEGCSMAILEAMVMEKNILTVHGGGNGEIIKDEINGIIVPYDDNLILEGLIRSYKKKDDDSMKKKAYLDATTKYSWKSITDNYINLYLKE